MTSCNDLTSAEHAALRTLQKAAKGISQTIVGAPPVKDVHLQALIETGHIEREVLGHQSCTRLVQGCTCRHSAGAVTRENAVPLAPVRAKGLYRRQPVVPLSTLSVASSSSSSNKAGTFSSYRLAKYFDAQSRRYSWECGLQTHEYPMLRRQLSAWNRDGANEAEVRDAIDAFFIDLATRAIERKGSLWKLFVSKRRRSIEMAAKNREAQDGEWSGDSARAFQASKDQLLGNAHS